MMRRTIFLVVFLYCLLGVSARDINAQERRSNLNPVASNPANTDRVTAETNSSDRYTAEVEALKRRIDDVEKQNRALLQMLTDLKAQKEGPEQSDEASTLQTSNSRNLKITPASDESPPETKKAQESVVRWSELLGEGNRIKFYGFLPTNGRTRTYAIFIANRITPDNNFLLGIDFLWWRTNYKGLLHGTNNRVNIFLQYNF